MKHNLLKGRRLTAAMLITLCTSTMWGESFPIDLTFSGRGESTDVQKVTVTNLSHPEIAPVTLSGTDILRLADEETITPIEHVEEAKVLSEPILTPNPALGDGTLIFDARQDGPVHISIYNTSGMLLDAATLNASKGRNTARIPSQGKGIFIVNIEGQGVKNSTRWICNGSKSFSGIALGGAQQWGESNLSVKNVFRAPAQKRSKGMADVVLMPFTPGDILRFEGTSGKMKTIMHVSPESSHAVTFDFFRCEDANGYNYPIVRIGDMLWMLEDLKPVKMAGLTKTSSTNIWKSIDPNDAAEFEKNGKAYYTVNGGRLAMPEGWEMPSIDEIYAMIKELQADTMQLGDFLKDRSFEDWPRPLIAGPDTIHLQLMPNGYINPDGELTNDEITGAWLTRNTMRHGRPVSYEISSLNTKFRPQVIHEDRCAFTLRGCRPAPSVYTEMLEQAFISSAEKSPQRRMPMQVVNTNGPLGTYYTYGSDRSSVFFDYSGIQLDGGYEKRSGILYKPNNKSAWIFSDKSMIKADVNGADVYRHLRKVTAQTNADGYENLVYATWSKPFRVFTDGSTTGRVADVAAVMGEGVVYLTVYGDSTKNHAILEGYESRPLLDAEGNEYLWKMPTFNNNKLSRRIFGQRSDLLADLRSEYFARAFNLKCIQDQTGDGVEEIVMNVANKIAIFDGVTLRCIRERVFVDEGSYIGTPNLRYDVADVNGDGYEDIVMVMNNNDIGSLRVYSKGYINEEPIVNKPLSSPTLFCDVKVGCMSNSDLPEIAILTRGLENNSNDLLTKNGYLYMYRLHYNNDLSLTEQIVLPKTSVDCFAANDETRNHVGNMDLVFGYFRGRNYTQDLIVGDGLWRWDETNAKPTFRFVALGSVKSASYSVAADAIAAVQASEADGKEILVFIWNMIVGKNDGCNHSLSEFWEVWVGNDGKTVNIRNSFNQDYFGWCNNGSTWSKDMKNPEETKWMYQNMRDGNELNSHPVLCKFADRVRPKRFRYVSHELTFSEPRIYAAIAAAPYYEGLSGSDRAETIWGKTTSTSDKSVKSDTWGGSVIGGYEHSFSVPFLGLSAGVEFTTKVTVSGSIATEHETTTSYGQTYAAGEDHVVVMHATPYDTYRYEILDSDDPDDIGTEFVLSMPRTRAFVGLKLADYVQLMASQKGVAKPQYHLTSTPGDPWSYPGNYDNAPMYVNDNYPFLKAKDLNGGFTNEMAGTGAYTSRSISLATSDARTTSVSVDVETELVATVNGVKAGVGFNYNHTNESTHTIGEEFTVEGSVPGLPSLNDMEHPQFRWNLVWYYVKDAGGVYPVVNYIVTRP